eukprot:scaffold5143_cov119-Isochrysis_galbana.AAC.20
MRRRCRRRGSTQAGTKIHTGPLRVRGSLMLGCNDLRRFFAEVDPLGLGTSTTSRSCRRSRRTLQGHGARSLCHGRLMCRPMTRCRASCARGLAAGVGHGASAPPTPPKT